MSDAGSGGPDTARVLAGVFVFLGMTSGMALMMGGLQRAGAWVMVGTLVFGYVFALRSGKFELPDTREELRVYLISGTLGVVAIAWMASDASINGRPYAIPFGVLAALGAGVVAWPLVESIRDRQRRDPYE